MSALQVQQTLAEIGRNMAELSPYRPPALFNEFLVKGYTAITLSSVPQEKFSDLLRAKLCLGTLITLYDDFADRPKQCDPQLLETLYQLKFGRHTPVIESRPHYRQVTEFARSLISEIDRILSPLPQFGRLCEVLNFDLAQFYLANQFSTLLTVHSHLNNGLENRLYAHHNMGMVIVATMDLMASDHLEYAELGNMREVFLMGQRMGRIFNVLATHEREVIDGDVTGELATCLSPRDVMGAKRKLKQEVRRLYKRIESYDLRVGTFSVPAYLEGLNKVQKLHERMEGVL